VFAKPEGGGRDLETIAQLTLDVEQLQPYFHVETFPERSPLVVVAPALSEQGAKLQKFGRPVVFKTREEAVESGGPYFEFKEIAVESGRATVRFEYPPEGIRGEIELAQTEASWKVVAARLVER